MFGKIAVIVMLLVFCGSFIVGAVTQNETMFENMLLVTGLVCIIGGFICLAEGMIKEKNTSNEGKLKQ
ncbi:MAG: hypothetical protein ACKUBY_00340 [Candidatus Moraniibacteriota bacterium]|jgi:hypothetical protein